MALEDILDGIAKDTKEKVEKLYAKANGESKSIIKNAEDEATAKMAGMVQKASMEIKSVQTRELARKRMEIKKRYYEELNGNILQAKSIIMDNIPKFKNTETYKSLLNVLYGQITTSLGKGCEVLISNDDIPLINFDRSTKVIKSDDITGGLLGRSKDGSKEIDYTIRSIMDTIESDLITSLSRAIDPKVGREE